MPRRPKLQPPPPKAENKFVRPAMVRSFPSDSRSFWAKITLIGGLSLATLGAIGVVAILPELIVEHPDAPMASSDLPKATKQNTQAADTSVAKSEDRHSDEGVVDLINIGLEITIPQEKDSERQAQVKLEPEELLREVLQQRAILENDGVKIWGKQRFLTSYSEAITKFTTATEHYDSQRFDQAVKSYRETLALFDQLRASRPDRLKNAIGAGTEALRRLDDEAAREQFEIALSLDPVNSLAKHGLRRADSLRQVVNLTEQGQAFETKGKFDQARSAYAEAVSLDGDYRPAHEHLRRLDEVILARDFQSAISEAMAALSRKQYEDSHRALDRADRIRPNAPEVRGIRGQVQAAVQLVALERLRQTAMRHEEGERWNQALQAYEEALGIDEHANFAARGKARAAKFSQLTQQIDFYLLNPDRLQSPEPLAHAREVVEVADTFSNAGAKLRDGRESLRNLIDAYSTPRSVIFRSDNRTDVTVYRVKKFGQFSETRIALLPGVYTAVGTLAGFRDVRIRFRVPPKDGETMVVVRCEERI